MSINDVCQATGLTKGAVFHQVSDKAALGIAADRLLAYVDQRQAISRQFGAT